jgi:hypothetical protein
MPSINRHIVNDEMTQFVTELNQLGLIEFFYIVRAIDFSQKRAGRDKHDFSGIKRLTMGLNQLFWLGKPFTIL